MAPPWPMVSSYGCKSSISWPSARKASHVAGGKRDSSLGVSARHMPRDGLSGSAGKQGPAGQGLWERLR